MVAKTVKRTQAKSKRAAKPKSGIRLRKRTRKSWAIPVVLGTVVIGGLFVWNAMAANLYPYQYSAYRCHDGKFDKNTINLDDKCVNESAEALTFRFYKGIKDGSPDSGGYNYWVQQLAGDRRQPTDVASTIIAQSGINQQSNNDFVATVYRNMHGIAIDSKGRAYWKKRLDDKSWSRGKMVAHWASQVNAKKAQRVAFAAYVKRVDRVTITETAIQERDKLLYSAASNSNAARKLYLPLQQSVKDSRQIRDSARAVSSKMAPSRADLQAIADAEKKVRSYAAAVGGPVIKLKAYERQNAMYSSRATAISDYSPDIQSNRIKAEYNKTIVYRAATTTISKDLNNLIKEISRFYRTAERKYETALKEAAAREAAANASAGNSSTGETAGTTPKSPPPEGEKEVGVPSCNDYAKKHIAYEYKKIDGGRTSLYRYRYTDGVTAHLCVTTGWSEWMTDTMVNAQSITPKPVYPKVPYRLCGSGAFDTMNERCISSVSYKTDAWGQLYVSKVYSCRLFLGISGSCKNEYGKWRYTHF